MLYFYLAFLSSKFVGVETNYERGRNLRGKKRSEMNKTANSRCGSHTKVKPVKNTVRQSPPGLGTRLFSIHLHPECGQNLFNSGKAMNSFPLQSVSLSKAYIYER